MGIRNFGLKEAKRAGEFAKSKEQRSTVLAVVRLFNIPIIVKQQAAKVVAKAELAFKKKRAKLKNFDAKVVRLESAARLDVLKKADVLEVSNGWDV